MNYVNSIFKRMDLKEICSFLLEGLESCDIENDTYENRLRTGSNAIFKRLEKLCPNEEELDEAVSDLSEALIIYKSIYMEIGMKSGAESEF